MDHNDNEAKLFGISKLTKVDTIREPNSNDFTNQRDNIFQIDYSKAKQSLVKLEFCAANTFVLLSNGEVYSKGKGEVTGRKKVNFTQNFGLVEIQRDNEKNQKIQKELKAKTIIYDISAGTNHILALDNSYSVWGWGDNSFHQIIPKGVNKNYPFPTVIEFNRNIVVNMIKAYNNSSFVITSKNAVISWGEVNIKAAKDKKDGDYSNEFFVYDEMSKIIDYIMFKDTSDYTDAFVNLRKVLNSKFLQNAKGEELRKAKIEARLKKIKELQQEMESRQKDDKQFTSYLTSNVNDKKVIVLQELLRRYEKKINRITVEKEQLRRNLTKIDGEINEEKSDMTNNEKLIDEVETEIENLYNKITTTETKGGNLEEKNVTKTEISSVITEKQPQSEPKSEEIIELQKQIHNKEIFKESLNKNLQVISSSLDAKEKERSLIVSSINKVTDKENNYLQARYTIEEMIQVLFDSINYKKSVQIQNNLQAAQGINISAKSLHFKIKEIYTKLLEMNEIAEKISYISIHIAAPYKLTSDILKESNEQIKMIKENIEKLKSTQSETVKNDLKIIYELIESKLNLIDEQNKMINIIYVLLSSLKESDVRTYFQDKNKMRENVSSTVIVKDDINDNIEYVYKDIIINLIKETFWLVKEEEKLLKMDAEGSKDKQEKYIEDKIAQLKKLKDRNPIAQENKDTNYDECVTYNYKNEAELNSSTSSGSNFNWNFSMPDFNILNNNTPTPKETAENTPNN